MKERCQRCQRDDLNSMRAFSFFSRNFFRYLSQVIGRCQRYQRGTMSCVRVFSLLGQKFFLISHGKRDVSVVQTRYPEKYESIFVFRSNKFFYNILISESRTSEKEVSAVPTQWPKPNASIFVFQSKHFFFDIFHR